MRRHLIALLVLAAATTNALAQPAGGIEDSTGEALQMLRRARLAMQVGDAEQARSLVREALDYGLRAKDAKVLAWAHQMIGEITFANSEPQAAVESFNKALEAFTKLNDRLGMAGSRVNLGRLLAARGETKDALAHQIAARDLYKDLDRPTALAATLADLGETYRALGRMGDAVTALQEALKLQRNESVPPGAEHLRVFLGLGLCRLDEGDASGAIEHLQAAAQLLTTVNDPAQEANVRNALGMAHQRQSALEDAMREYQAALTIWTGTDRNAAGEATVRNNLGALHLDRGAIQDAIGELEQALHLYEQLNDRAGQARTLYNLAVAHEGRGDNAASVQRYEKALTLRREANDSAGAARILENLALLYAADGDIDRAKTSRDEAERLRTRQR